MGRAAKKSWTEVVSECCSEGMSLGYDPTLISVSSLKAKTEHFAKKNITLVPIDMNLADEIWGEDRPGVSLEKPFLHPVEFSGEDSKSKLGRVSATCKDSSMIVCNLDEIAWLLNMRGNDIDYNPLFYSFVILSFKA